MCSGSEAGSYLRLIDFVHQSFLGLRVIKKKVTVPKKSAPPSCAEIERDVTSSPENPGGETKMRSPRRIACDHTRL